MVKFYFLYFFFQVDPNGTSVTLQSSDKKTVNIIFDEPIMVRKYKKHNY